jgi:glycyl-tRNA synthetase alpha chain
MWNDKVTYGDVHKKGEWELSVYSFELADVDMLRKMFDLCEQESLKISEEGIVLPAYDYCLKCSHLFNILEARGAISVTERTHYIDRIRNLARLVAKNYLAQREEMGFPLMNRG